MPVEGSYLRHKAQNIKKMVRASYWICRPAKWFQLLPGRSQFRKNQVHFVYNFLGVFDTKYRKTTENNTTFVRSWKRSDLVRCITFSVFPSNPIGWWERKNFPWKGDNDEENLTKSLMFFQFLINLVVFPIISNFFNQRTLCEIFASID